MAVDGLPERFRAAMGRWATGVSVVTTHEGGTDSGMTVNALLSIALDPPLLLVSLACDAESTPRVARAGRFAVNVLAADQRPLSERFARAIPTGEKFAGIATHPGRGNVPLLDGCLAHLECRVRRAITVADHCLFIGEVKALTLGPEAPPLVFAGGRYASAEGPELLRLPARR